MYDRDQWPVRHPGPRRPCAINRAPRLGFPAGSRIGLDHDWVVIAGLGWVSAEAVASSRAISWRHSGSHRACNRSMRPASISLAVFITLSLYSLGEHGASMAQPAAPAGRGRPRNPCWGICERPSATSRHSICSFCSETVVADTTVANTHIVFMYNNNNNSIVGDP
jgi:hypothetical protein